mgnify:CR=1 FL=1
MPGSYITDSTVYMSNICTAVEEKFKSTVRSIKYMGIDRAVIQDLAMETAKRFQQSGLIDLTPVCVIRHFLAHGISTIKKPTDDIEAIRDATVAALIAEDEKAQEVKNSLDIALLMSATLELSNFSSSL